MKRAEAIDGLRVHVGKTGEIGVVYGVRLGRVLVKFEREGRGQGAFLARDLEPVAKQAELRTIPRGQPVVTVTLHPMDAELCIDALRLLAAVTDARAAECARDPAAFEQLRALKRRVAVALLLAERFA